MYTFAPCLLRRHPTFFIIRKNLRVVMSCCHVSMGVGEMLSFTIFPGPMKNTPENCRIKGQSVILADIHVDSLLL